MCAQRSSLRLDDLTVGIATYNGEGHVAQAVASALALGARVVISDDGSQDGTRTVLERMKGRARVVEQPRNLGIGGNYQFLLEACETTHLLLLNQDDILLAEALAGASPRVGEITVFNGWVLDDFSVRGRPIYRRPPFHASMHGVYRGLRVENFIRSPSQVVFPVKEARDLGGFIVDLDAGQGAEDWMCWLRLASANLRFTLLMKPRVGYRVHSGNYSNNSAILGASRRTVRERLPAEPRRDARLRLRW